MPDSPNRPTELRIREGFPDQRLVVLPAQTVARCRALPLVRVLHVTDIGLFPAAPHHYVDRPQGVPQAILIYCLAGAGRLHVEDREFPVAAGHALVIPPHTAHRYQAARHDPWSLWWIHFDGEHVADALHGLGTRLDRPLVFVPDTDLMRRAFEDVYSCLHHPDRDAGLLAMTGELMRLFGRIKLHQAHPQPQRRSAAQRVLETLTFMREHLNLPLNVEELAARTGQSVPYFNRLFREETSQSPMAYFIRLKTQKACELLDHTDLTVRQIASELGYADPYYFSRQFKKVQGCSPTHYRQSVKG